MIQINQHHDRSHSLARFRVLERRLTRLEDTQLTGREINSSFDHVYEEIDTLEDRMNQIVDTPAEKLYQRLEARIDRLELKIEQRFDELNRKLELTIATRDKTSRSND